MKKVILLLFVLIQVPVLAQNFDYFPADTRFDTSIKSPKEFFRYDVGSFHTRYDKLVEYMYYLADASDRVEIEVFGVSVEKRPQIMLTVTNSDNHSRLEDIRSEHLKLSDPTFNGEIDASLPVIVQLGFNVHGNETSGGESSILVAYYYAAVQGNEIEDILKNSVIFIEPILNPDGRDRFVTWVNMNRGKVPSPDGNDREHSEAWPGGRTNHYWFDLNRDWLPLVQQESQHRLFRYHKWRPNVITDHHEMGTNSTFFFEPTKPGSENPIVPAENYLKLNKLFATKYAEALNKLGNYYDSGLSFDNSYPGYGSTYGDVNGGLAILFEQASTRGLIQRTDLGYIMHYSLGIENQLTGALVSVETAVDNRVMLNDYMRRFYKESYAAAKTGKVKSYVFGDPSDFGRTKDFLNLLRLHDIKVYMIKDDEFVNGYKFTSGSCFSVPVDQAQYRMIQSMFETNLSFTDSLFYDASAWSMIHAYGLPHAALTKDISNRELGPLSTIEDSPQSLTKSEYGYIFNWSEYYAGKALTLIQEAGIKTKAAYEPVSIYSNGEEVSFSRGSIFIPVQAQDLSHEEVLATLKLADKISGVKIYPVESSVTKEGPWMGNGSFRSMQKPKVLMLTGDGVRSSSAGTVWNLFDTRVEMEITKLDVNRLGRVKLYDYNVLILPSGSYSTISKSDSDRIIEWINSGGKIITLGNSYSWLLSNKLISFKRKNREVESVRLDYNKSRQANGKHSIGGVYINADIDNTHPLGFGYNNRNLVVYKNNTTFVEQVKSATSNIVVYNENPVLSGYVSKENKELIGGCSSLMQFSKGRGTITVFIDDPVFRGTWRGTDKILMNAIFF